MTLNLCSVIQGIEANNRKSDQNDMTGQLEQRNETQRRLKHERPGEFVISIIARRINSLKTCERIIG
jgi:hypothetical protein